MSILIYDDNVENLKVMEDTLTSTGYEIKTSKDIIESIRIVEDSSDKVEMIITKNNINDFSLKDYLYILRKLNKNIRVVVLSNSMDSKDEIESIELCVDDYIKKPVSKKVIQKRIERLLNNKSAESVFHLKRDMIVIDTLNNTVKKKDTYIDLSMKEYKILVYLVRFSNCIVSRQELYEHIWGKDYCISRARTIDVHISNLRTKLDLECLYSIRGTGYKIEN